MYTFLIVLILIASVLMVLAVLVQSPKSGMAFEGCASLAVITFDDPSGWYRTQSENDFDYCTNGVPTDVNDPEYFTKDYIDYYWYKL